MEKFEKPELKIFCFDSADVITTSCSPDLGCQYDMTGDGVSDYEFMTKN